jgi:hypothetical protein
MNKALGGIAVAAALLALPMAATGQAARGGDDFVLAMTLEVSPEGEPTKIERFRFRKLDATCDGDIVTEVRGRMGNMQVNDRNRFHKSVERNGLTMRVRGVVSGDLERMRGRIRVRGDVNSTLQNCDSGRVFWRAEVG